MAANRDWKNQLTQILDRLNKLEEKYSGLGQDMLSYLDGLYYSNGLNYWDYIHLDSLLGLQNPRTPFPDEVIFITYHQITELQFMLVKREIANLTTERGEDSEYLSLESWQKRIGRIVNYFRHLANSFDIMGSGMDKGDFNKFRKALLPASGFQSVQFREIEILCTKLGQLTRGVAVDPEMPLEEVYNHIYWKQGGIDLESGKKTITLEAFEEKYDDHLLNLIQKSKDKNLWELYLNSSEEIQSDENLKELLREMDQAVNVFWKLGHLASAAKHLVSGENAVDATGGTNWRTFLPPRYQKIQFFPGLWNETEIDEWGKAAVVKRFNEIVTQNWMK
ncbi:tryptophan 2,3-dioxygenase family protein [Pontibacter sp. G13]|uniref:tryptophan 2,3-dioxygenase family protein n=1 Tax=Pontibacter sp. G13 TaxID=3074898 RepID=UPI00288C5975|nr:tryptophan 2,3-dioxygenase family protein [Pontibacter sp. G13]WNJ16325.1 tryptophan 2,3-dioxygenase family protein [Pontibacter sp. G13]